MFAVGRASVVATAASGATSSPRGAAPRASVARAPRGSPRLASSRIVGGAARLRSARVASRGGPSRRAGSRRAARVSALFGPPPDPEALLAEGKALYASGERMQGFKKFERALRAEPDRLALATRQELLYSCMCCNAAFGDVETAKQYLRDMNIAGLPFDVALATDGFMPLESSAQMRNQLVKFASGEMKSQGTVQREIFERDRGQRAGAPGGSVGAGPGGQKPQRMGDMDLMNLDISGDTSAEVGDIAKRVVGLALLSVLGFVGLFKFGLQFLNQ